MTLSMSIEMSKGKRLEMIPNSKPNIKSINLSIAQVSKVCTTLHNLQQEAVSMQQISSSQVFRMLLSTGVEVTTMPEKPKQVASAMSMILSSVYSNFSKSIPEYSILISTFIMEMVLKKLSTTLTEL